MPYLPIASAATGIAASVIAFIVVAALLYSAMEWLIRRADRRYDKRSGDASRKHLG